MEPQNAALKPPWLQKNRPPAPFAELGRQSNLRDLVALVVLHAAADGGAVIPLGQDHAAGRERRIGGPSICGNCSLDFMPSSLRRNGTGCTLCAALPDVPVTVFFAFNVDRRLVGIADFVFRCIFRVLHPRGRRLVFGCGSCCRSTEPSVRCSRTQRSSRCSRCSSAAALRRHCLLEVPRRRFDAR